MHRWAILILALAAVGAGCSGTSIEATRSTETLNSGIADDSSTSQATTRPTQETVKESAGLSPGDPLPVGDVQQSSFAYEEAGLVAWDGFIIGMVATGLSEYNDLAGQCFLVLGTLTPTSIEEGSVTSGFETPTVSVIAGGQQIQSEVNQCDTSTAKAAGYDWILNAEVTVGTTFPFYDEIFLPGQTTPDIEALVIGDPSTTEALYYEPTILPETPTPNVSQSSAGRDLLPVGDVQQSSFAYEEAGLVAWDGFIIGMVATGLSEYNDLAGQCFLVLGTLTPTSIEEGSVTSGFETPTVSVIAGGQQIQSEVNQCDTSTAKAAGYDWILNAEVTVGTTFPFYDEIFLPGQTTPDIEALVIGDPSTTEALYYEPTILPETPTP